MPLELRHPPDESCLELVVALGAAVDGLARDARVAAQKCPRLRVLGAVASRFILPRRLRGGEGAAKVHI